MKDVVFFTPNRGLESAIEFISNALNYGGPPRFSLIKFDLIDKDKDGAVRMNTFDTSFRAGHQSLFSVEAVQVCGDEGDRFFLRTTVRTQSLRGSIKSSAMIPIPEKQARFPEITGEWQEEMRQKLGHQTLQDLWNQLLDVDKIRRMPL